VWQLARDDASRPPPAGTARARLGTLGRLNYAERRSDSNTVSYLCTVSAAPKLGSASAGASEVSVKTLTLTTPTPTHFHHNLIDVCASELWGG
jgi:hypothetical protein